MQLCLFLMLLSQSITDLVFFHWFNSKIVLSSELISSGKILLIFPNSLFEGFINLLLGFDLKSFLWSFSVMKAWVFARQFIRSSRSMFSAIFLASKLISWSRFFGAFSYVLVMFFLSSLLCSSGFNSYMLLVFGPERKLWVRILSFQCPFFVFFGIHLCFLETLYF